MQGETRLNEQEQSFLIQKLANLAGTGNDNLSYQKIVEKLNKKQLEEIGTERTLERPINLVNRKLAELEKQIQELKMTFARKDNLEQEKQEIKNQIEEKENPYEMRQCRIGVFQLIIRLQNQFILRGIPQISTKASLISLHPTN